MTSDQTPERRATPLRAATAGEGTPHPSSPSSPATSLAKSKARESHKAGSGITYRSDKALGQPVGGNGRNVHGSQTLGSTLDHDAARPAHSLEEMIEDWKARHGEPRRFEPGCSNAYWIMKRFLEARGYSLSIRGSYVYLGRLGGQETRTTWPKVSEIVDRLRVADGLEPMFVGHRA